MKHWIAIAIVLILAVKNDAQSDCGNGLPCGAIPWTLPRFAPLQSPTPNGGGFASVGTPTPSPTPVDVGGIFAGSSQLLSTPSWTLTPEYASLVADSALFFSYVRAVQEVDFGVFQPLLAFVFTIFALTVGFKATMLVLPFLAFLFGLMRRVIEMIPWIQ